MELNNNYSIKVLWRTKKGTAFNIVFAVLFLFLFSAATESRAKSLPAHNDESSFTSNQTDNGPGHSPHVPFGSKPALPFNESPDENEVEKELDSDEDDSEHRNRAIEAGVSQNSSETSRLNYRRLFHHHTSVSLVILYHSWKSYLS